MNPEQLLYNTLIKNSQSNGYNATGRNAGSNDNFITKKAKSIENALGTTAATAIGGVNELITNESRNNMVKDQKTRMNDVAKKYGFNTYQDVWDARDKAEAEGDTKTLDLINNTINPELQAQATANKNEMDKFASDYKDYVKNDYIGKKTNQDAGKFLGSAINTESTLFDVLTMAAGIPVGAIGNAVQGGVEGIADELEQSGFKDFDWQRAGQNALTGAASGAVTGKLNQSVSNALAKNGGNLFKGGNAVTRTFNNLGSNTKLGQIGSTLATGATRGAVSGAVGGATGAGLQSAMQGASVGEGISNALQGAVSGAKQGAIAGGTMAGANMAIDTALAKTNPDLYKSVKENQANNAMLGDNLKEQWKNAGEPITEAPIQKAAPIAETTPEAKNITTGDNTAQWDAVAKEAGFQNYDDLMNRFSQSNPNVQPTADKILDWADQLATEQKATFTEAKTGKQIKNERAIVEELMKQFNPVDKPTTRATKPSETFYNLHNKLGLSDGDQIRQAVHYAEPGQLVPTLIRESAGKAGVVDMTDAQTLVNDLKLNKRQNYKKTLAVLEDIIDSTPSTISGGKDGVDALQLQRTLESMASDARGTSGEYHIGNNVVDQTTATNLSRIAKSIGENLDKAAVSTGAVQATLSKYANEIQQMRNAYPKNTKWQAMVDNEIAGAKTIGQLRSSIRDLTRASIFINNGDENVASFGGRFAQTNIPASKAGVTNRLVNTAVEKVSETPLARDARLWWYEKNAKAGNNKALGANTAQTAELPASTAPTPTTVAEAPNNYSQSSQLYNAIGRTEGLNNADQARTANYLVEAVQNTGTGGNTLESLIIPTTTGSTGVYDSLYGSNTTTTPTTTQSTPTQNSYFQPTGDYWTDILAKAMTSAIDADDVEAFASLYGMYQDSLANLQKSSSSSDAKLTDKQRQANAAARALEDFESTESNFGYDVSDIPILSNLANMGGNEYASKAEALALQVGYMLSGATVNKDEALKIGKAYVPQPRDSQAVRQSKINQLRGIISDYQQTYA